MSTEVDPHASKIATNDPRLHLRAAPGRTLKKGPAVALVVLLGGTVAASLVIALLPNSKAAAKKADVPPPVAPPAPVIPDAIRNAPEPPAYRKPPPPTDRLLVVPLPDAGMSEFPRRYGGGGRDPSGDQDLRARGAGILFEGSRSAPETNSPPPLSVPAASAGAALAASAAHAPNGNAADIDPNLQERKNAFLDSEGATKTTDVLRASIQHPRSAYEIKAGTIVPALLITAINSDLPGPVIGQVRENVYDTVSGNYLLIPQGSRLLAQYDSMVSWGQERVLVCWNRLIFPNGDSIRLECMPAADLTGAAGLADEVNEHWGKILKSAAVATLLSATTEAAAGNTQSMNPTVPQMWAHGAATEVNQVGQQITQRNIMIQPTITVRPGFSVNVVVTKDLVLPNPYSSDSPIAALGKVR